MGQKTSVFDGLIRPNCDKAVVVTHSALEKNDPVEGGCLCGGVRYRLTPPLRAVVMCHCRQCQRWTGHAVAATAVAPDRFLMTRGEENIGWYAASELAARGFCKRCGSSLFWRTSDGDRVSVMAGTLDDAAGLITAAHIFCADKAAYHQLPDDAPHLPQGGSDDLLAEAEASAADCLEGR